VLIEIGVISTLIDDRYPNSISVERDWSRINIDKYPRHISVDRNWSRINIDKHPKHIHVNRIGVVSTLINIQNIFM
jgi:hypothetical protein